MFIQECFRMKTHWVGVLESHCESSDRISIHVCPCLQVHIIESKPFIHISKSLTKISNGKMQYSELLNSQNVKFQFSHLKAEIVILK